MLLQYIYIYSINEFYVPHSIHQPAFYYLIFLSDILTYILYAYLSSMCIWYNTLYNIFNLIYYCLVKLNLKFEPLYIRTM